MTKDDQARTLDEYVDRLHQPDQRLEELKADLPVGQEGLWSLLTLAKSLESFTPSGPKSGFINHARIRIWNRLQNSKKHTTSRSSRHNRSGLVWRRALAGGLLALVLMVSGLGVASASALPGDALYGFKRGVESLRLALAFSEEQEAGLLIGFAEERLEEIEALSQVDRPSDLVWALDEYTQTVDALVDLSSANAGEWDESFDEALSSLSNNAQVLVQVRDRVPENAQDAIDNAIERSNHGQSVLEILQQGGDPSDLAPGQQDGPNNNQDNQPNNPSENAPAHGRDKDKIHPGNNGGNRGRGNSNAGGNGNRPVNPQDSVEEEQDED